MIDVCSYKVKENLQDQDTIEGADTLFQLRKLEKHFENIVARLSHMTVNH